MSSTRVRPGTTPGIGIAAGLSRRRRRWEEPESDAGRAMGPGAVGSVGEWYCRDEMERRR